MADTGFRVLVAGSDNWDDGHTVFRVLNEILNEQGTPFTVITGGHERGAGQITRMWCQVHPAGMIHLKARPGRPFTALAGAYAPNLVVAFLMPCRRTGCWCGGLGWDHGPDDAVQYARAQGIPVRTLEAVTF